MNYFASRHLIPCAFFAYAYASAVRRAGMRRLA